MHRFDEDRRRILLGAATWMAGSALAAETLAATRPDLDLAADSTLAQLRHSAAVHYGPDPSERDAAEALRDLHACRLANPQLVFLAAMEDLAVRRFGKARQGIEVELDPNGTGLRQPVQVSGEAIGDIECRAYA